MLARCSIIVARAVQRGVSALDALKARCAGHVYVATSLHITQLITNHTYIVRVQHCRLKRHEVRLARATTQRWCANDFCLPPHYSLDRRLGWFRTTTTYAGIDATPHTDRRSIV
jgi:hypothetical protein